MHRFVFTRHSGLCTTQHLDFHSSFTNYRFWSATANQNRERLEVETIHITQGPNIYRFIIELSMLFY